MIIGFTGQKENGKTTAAEMTGLPVLSLATPIKRVAELMVGVDAPDKKDEVYIGHQFRSGRILAMIFEFFGFSEEEYKTNAYIERFGQTSQMLAFDFTREVLSRLVGHTMTYRKLLQLLGTEYGRDTFYEDIWVDHLLDRAPEREDWVVDDVRFVNEANKLKSQGAIIVGIVRDEFAQAEHRSEQEMKDRWEDMVDFTIRNDGTLDKLQHAVTGLVTGRGASEEE